MVESNFWLAPFQVVGQALPGAGGVCAAPRAGAAFRSTFGLAPKSRPGEVETLCLEIPNTHTYIYNYLYINIYIYASTIVY